MASGEGSESPVWLRALGALIILLIFGGLAYAISIALINFHNIGV